MRITIKKEAVMKFKEMLDNVCRFTESPRYPEIVKINPGIEKKLDQLSEILKSSEVSHDCERMTYEFVELCGEELKNLKKEKHAG
jgi:hypothetical protein